MQYFTQADRWLVIVVGFLALSVGCMLVAPPDGTDEDNSGVATPDITVPVTGELGPLDGATEETPGMSTAVVPVTSESDRLTGTRWELVTFEGTETVPTISAQPQPFIEFNQGILVLRNTCNSPGGHYQLENDHITITLAEMTEVDCTEELGTGVMEVESAFFAAMLTFESYSIEDDQLRIQYENGEILFRRLSE